MGPLVPENFLAGRKKKGKEEKGEERKEGKEEKER
jgi:hypothetical protein